MVTFEREDTATKVIDLIASELKLDRGAVSEQVTFQELGADSLDMVEIMMKLEEQFGIEIKDEDAEHLISVKDVVEYVVSTRTK